MAGRYDFTIDQGETFSRTLTWKDGAGTPVNLTGYTANFTLRDASGLVLLTLTTENGGIVLGGAAGTIAITATAVQTAGLPVVSAPYTLKLISSSAAVKDLLKGSVVVSRSQV